MNIEKTTLRLLPISLHPPKNPETFGVIEVAVKVHFLSESEKTALTLSGSCSTVIDTDGWETEVIWQTVRLLVDKFDRPYRELIPDLEKSLEQLKSSDRDADP
jgi:hypothetical protein